MSLSPARSEDISRQPTIGGYFGPLASAKHVLLTTFKPGRTPVSTRVRVVADGNRAYLQTWVPSGTARRLRQTNWVQLASCTADGMCRYGAQLDATPRLLDGEEASDAARKLARNHPARRDRLRSLAYRLRRGQPAYYELLPCSAADIPEAG